MKPDEDEITIVTDPHAPKPWAAILVGAFLSVCGIGAGAYGIVAVTFGGATTSEIVQVQSPNAGAPQPEVNGPTAQQNADGPLRTSTTRRRTVPRSVPRTSAAAETTVVDTDDTSVAVPDDGATLEEEPATGEDGSTPEQPATNGEQPASDAPTPDPAVPAEAQVD